MIKEELAMRGRLNIKLFDREGNLIGERRNNNKIVSSGRELVANLFGGTGVSPISHFSIGTGSSPTSDNASGLEQIALINGSNDQKAISIGPVSSMGNSQWKVEINGVLTMAEGNGLDITEVGLFTASPSPVMYNRVVFQEINKTSLFELQLFWEIIF